MILIGYDLILLLLDLVYWIIEEWFYKSNFNFAYWCTSWINMELFHWLKWMPDLLYIWCPCHIKQMFFLTTFNIITKTINKHYWYKVTCYKPLMNWYLQTHSCIYCIHLLILKLKNCMHVQEPHKYQYWNLGEKTEHFPPKIW